MSGTSDSEPSAPALTRRPRLELSLTQILGSTGAAVTAAFLGSRLGVAGTLIGAALASVISVVGGAVYTTSIKATRRRVARAIVAVRSPDEGDIPPPIVPPPMAGTRGGLGVFRAPRHPVGRVDGRPRLHTRNSSSQSGPAGSRPERPPAAPRAGRRPAVRGIVVAVALSAAVFAGALVVVTGYESVSGSALSGGAAGGLTILGGDSDVSDKSTRAVVTTTKTATDSSTTEGKVAGGNSTTASSTVTSRQTAATSAPPTASTSGQSTTGSRTTTDQPGPTTDQPSPTTDQPAPTTAPTSASTGTASTGTASTATGPTATPDGPFATSSDAVGSGLAPGDNSTTVVHSGPAR